MIGCNDVWSDVLSSRRNAREATLLTDLDKGDLTSEEVQSQEEKRGEKREENRLTNADGCKDLVQEFVPEFVTPDGKVDGCQAVHLVHWSSYDSILGQRRSG